jgi:3-hydroxybutyryl-CoA dehydrogenase
MKIEKFGVIGSGTMGSAISYLLAFNEFDVTIVDVNEDLLKRSRKRIGEVIDTQIKFNKTRPERELAKIEKLGIKLNDDQKEQLNTHLLSAYDEKRGDEIKKRITVTTDYEKLTDRDFIIEAAFENMGVKGEILNKLSKILKKEAIVASNSSSLSVTEMAEKYIYPDKFILTHFFNPPYTLPLVEIVRGMKTSDQTFQTTMSMFSKMNNHRTSMKPICVKEVPGFLVNRILVPMINEAFIMLDENVASAEDIDTAMKNGAGMPMGPLELADMVGLDITYDVMKVLETEYGDPKYRTSLLLKKYKESGRFGRKTKKGVYDY